MRTLDPIPDVDPDDCVDVTVTLTVSVPRRLAGEGLRFVGAQVPLVPAGHEGSFFGSVVRAGVVVPRPRDPSPGV